MHELLAAQTDRMNHYHDVEAAFQRQQPGLSLPGDSFLLLGSDFSKDVDRLADVRRRLAELDIANPRADIRASLESDALLPPVVLQEIQILLTYERSPALDAQVTRLRQFYTADLSQN